MTMYYIAHVRGNLNNWHNNLFRIGIKSNFLCLIKIVPVLITLLLITKIFLSKNVSTLFFFLQKYLYMHLLLNFSTQILKKKVYYFNLTA